MLLLLLLLRWPLDAALYPITSSSTSIYCPYGIVISEDSTNAYALASSQTYSVFLWVKFSAQPASSQMIWSLEDLSGVLLQLQKNSDDSFSIAVRHHPGVTSSLATVAVGGNPVGTWEYVAAGVDQTSIDIRVLTRGTLARETLPLTNPEMLNFIYSTLTIGGLIDSNCLLVSLT